MNFILLAIFFAVIGFVLYTFRFSTYEPYFLADYPNYHICRCVKSPPPDPNTNVFTDHHDDGDDGRHLF